MGRVSPIRFPTLPTGQHCSIKPSRLPFCWSFKELLLIPHLPCPRSHALVFSVSIQPQLDLHIDFHGCKGPDGGAAIQPKSRYFKRNKAPSFWSEQITKEAALRNWIKQKSREFITLKVTFNPIFLPVIIFLPFPSFVLPSSLPSFLPSLTCPFPLFLPSLVFKILSIESPT